MLSTEDRARFAYLGLDIAAVEARVTKAAGTPAVAIDTVIVFLGTALVLHVPATGRTYLLDAPEDNEAWPYRFRWFRSRKALPLANLGASRARR